MKEKSRNSFYHNALYCCSAPIVTEQADLQEDHGLPRGEIIPEIYKQISLPWVKVGILHLDK